MPSLELVAGGLITGFVAFVACLIAVVGFAWTIVVLLGLFIVILIMIIVYQERLLYIPVIGGYKTASDNPEGYRNPSEWDAEYNEFYVTTRDGEKIHGWHIHRNRDVRGKFALKKRRSAANVYPISLASSNGGSVATIIFCHENAGNIGLRVNNLVEMSEQLDVDVVAFDYRGYGESTGKPSEEGLIADTDAVFKYTVEELHAKNVFLYGRSLGGAVALQYAAVVEEDAPLLGVIAENTFTSIADMVGSVMPIFNFHLVKKYCLRLKWDTHQWVRLIRTPVLLLSGLEDEIVPAAHMSELKRICDDHKVKAELVTFAEGTHNDTWTVGGKPYWAAIRTYMTRLL